MGSYHYMEWTGDNGRVESAQTDKGYYHLKNYSGVSTGSGKLVLKEYPIDKQTFEANKRGGVTTV